MININELLEMCKRKIINGESFDEIKKPLVLIHGGSIFSQIENELKSYIEEKNNRDEVNKPYWMLICNPSLWGEDTETYEVNKLLYALNEDSIQAWKINDLTSMELQMKKGHRGIIKVSDDKRTKLDRMNDNDETVPFLNAGIYGIFEVIEDEDGDCTYEAKNGEYYVNIKVIDNFYSKGENISKEKSIELLGKTYNSRPSTKIDKSLFENVVNHMKTK